MSLKDESSAPAPAPRVFEDAGRNRWRMVPENPPASFVMAFRNAATALDYKAAYQKLLELCPQPEILDSGVYRINVESRSFSFEALGSTREEAIEVLRSGMAKHVEQYAGRVDPRWVEAVIKEGSNEVRLLEPGVCYRDGEVLSRLRDSSGDDVKTSGRRLYSALQSMISLHWDWEPGGRATRRLCDANDVIVKEARAAMKASPVSFRISGEAHPGADVDVTGIICRLAGADDDNAQERLNLIQRLSSRETTAEAYQEAIEAAEALLGDQPKFDRPRG